MAERDRSEEGKSPMPAEEQDGPVPERPVPREEERRTTGQPEKPSQAEGTREQAEE